MPTCNTCEKYLLDSELAGHRCPPRFECIDIDELDQFEEFGEADDEEPEWTAIYALTANDAAEKFAKKNLEYEGSIRVRVRNVHGVTLDLRVTAEYQLRFDASPDGAISDPTRWQRYELAGSLDFHKRTEMVAA